LPADRLHSFVSKNNRRNLESLADGFAPGGHSPAAGRPAVDIDMDTWTDAVGMTLDGKPILLHNNGFGKLVPDAFGPVGQALGIAVADLDGDGLTCS
jgi:hypothetical protein